MQIFYVFACNELSRMSYQPLKEDELVLGILQTSDIAETPETETEEKRSPRHSICLSLVLAVIAHCCCMGLGIIPLIMVIFAYVKRETGKYEDARRINQYSKSVSTCLIIFFILLLSFAFFYSVSVELHSKKFSRGLIAKPNPEDMRYPPTDYIENRYYTDDEDDGDLYYEDDEDGDMYAEDNEDGDMYYGDDEEYSDNDDQYQILDEDIIDDDDQLTEHQDEYYN